MLYQKKYYIKARFQRSANITLDNDFTNFLDNYIVTPNTCNIISKIITGITHGQSAFTLTGPYGGGKSSLCLFFMALLGTDKKIQTLAMSKISEVKNEGIESYVKSLKQGFTNLAIIAREENPVDILSQALGCKNRPDAILEQIDKWRKKHKRINIIIDEMGKILEADQDPFFLQTLAEYCNRSDGEVNFIGCMHSAFGEYTRGKARHVIEEWRKVQGRFFDIPVNTVQEEQLTLIGSAIESEVKQKITPEAIVKFIELNTLVSSKERKKEELLLRLAYPLHPATALMLAKYANSEISQSSRSIFSFLSSCEHFGFQEFLNNAEISEDNLYTPDILYNYIVSNFRNAIAVSDRAGTFATAQEILRELETDSDAGLAIKTITLWQIFRPHSQIKLTKQTLSVIYPKNNMRNTVENLENLGHIRSEGKYGYVISETSDFDLKEAKQDIKNKYNQQDLRSLEKPINFKTIVGKKHLFEKGTIRTMDIIIANINQVEYLEERSEKIGNFIMILPRNADEEEKAQKMLNSLSSQKEKHYIYSIAKSYEKISNINVEIHVLQKIFSENPVLKYNKVAKNIIRNLIENEEEVLQQQIEFELRNAQWKDYKGKYSDIKTKDYSQICSQWGDEIYHNSPIIKSELLNKNKVDSGAASGLRKLLEAMAGNADELRLGLEGYSAEASLYDIMLGNSKLHDASRSGNPYAVANKDEDICNITPLWKATTKKLSKKGAILSLKELYEFWTAPPFGIKEGLKPVLMLAYILAHSKNIAKYIKLERYEFHTELDEFFIHILYRRPQDVGLRYVGEEQKQSTIVSTLYQIAIENPQISDPQNKEILDIAISYKKFINNLPTCTKTTGNISLEARNFRNAIRNSEDPNKIISDIKIACSPDKILKIIKEISDYYPKRLNAISNHINEQLNMGLKFNGEVKKRGEKVKYYATDPDVKLLTEYLLIDDRIERTEKIIQMSTGKFPEHWSDQILNSSFIFINGHIDEFLRIERKIKLQTDESVLLCLRENGEYKEIEVSRDKAYKFIKQVQNAR